MGSTDLITHSLKNVLPFVSLKSILDNFIEIILVFHNEKKIPVHLSSYCGFPTYPPFIKVIPVRKVLP